MYNKNSLNKYIKQLLLDVDALMSFEEENNNTLLENTFKDVISNLEIDKRGHALSYVKDVINERKTA